jgi:hypothetical protein
MTMPVDFSSMINSALHGDVLIPIIHRMLYNPDFEGFQVEVEPWSSHGKDGWFHPSTHSMMTIRQLYLYLTKPDLFSEERMELSGVLAVTAGHFWHNFLQRLLLKDGILLQDEFPVQDLSTRRRGHVDGLLGNGEALEIKTINLYQIDKITTGTILKEKKPDYWHQTQDYLDMLGVRTMRYLMLAPTYPFKMVEFAVNADLEYQIRRRNEYLRAIELAEQYPDGTAADRTIDLAPVCCAPGSAQAKRCPARLACPVGRMS